MLSFLMFAMLTVSFPTEPISIGSWRIEQSGGPFGEMTCTIRAPAESGKLSLMVSARGLKTVVGVIAAESFVPEDLESIAIQYRFGARDPVEAEWGVSAGRLIFVEGDPSRFIRDLKRAHQFAFRTDGVTAVFPLSRTEDAIAEIYKRCAP